MNRVHCLIEKANVLDLARYPDKLRLEMTLSTLHNVDSNQVFIGNGSSDVLMRIGQSLLRTSDLALFSEYTFELFPQICRATQCRSTICDSMNYSHNIKKIVDLINQQDTRVLFIDNPCNPTGTVLETSDIIFLLENVPPKTIVVIDEAYFDYVLESRFTSCLSLVQRYENLIVSRTLSKAYGLAGLRLGYCISSPTLINYLKEKTPPYSVGTLTQSVAEAALISRDFVEKSVTINAQSRHYLFSNLYKYGIVPAQPNANYIFLRFLRNGENVSQVLSENGIKIRWFGHDFEYARVSIGLDIENEIFLQSVKKALNDAS